MHIILHIFRKDLRRLWPAVLVTLGLLVQLTRLDCWREDWLATTSEGWLNLLLPLAWACLIALLVQQEPLAGDRHFWITWPYRWQTLLGAKALFVLVTIHLPVLLADATILAYHGFPPAEYAGQLLAKQVQLAASVTGLALALATLFEGIAGFLLAAILIAGTAVYLGGGNDPVRTPWLTTDGIRAGLAVSIVAVTAGVIILIQYVRRQTAGSRIAGAGGVLFAGLVFGYLPPTAIARIRAVLHPATPNITLRLAASKPELPPGFGPSGRESEVAVVGVPVAVSGVPEGDDVRFRVLSLEMVGADGQRYRAPAQVPRRDFAKNDFDGWFIVTGQPASWLMLRVRRGVMSKIQDGGVEIRAVFEANLHRAGEAKWMAVGTAQTVRGVGRCSSAMIESPNVYQEGMLKVLCESPYGISPGTGVRLWQPETGTDWKQHLGDSAPSVPGPREVFLSPVERLQTFFHVVSGTRINSPGSKWLVPQEALANARLAIIPDVAGARTAVNFETRDLRLRDYEVSAR